MREKWVITEKCWVMHEKCGPYTKSVGEAHSVGYRNVWVLGEICEVKFAFSTTKSIELLAHQFKFHSKGPGVGGRDRDSVTVVKMLIKNASFPMKLWLFFSDYFRAGKFCASNLSPVFHRFLFFLLDLSTPLPLVCLQGSSFTRTKCALGNGN